MGRTIAVAFRSGRCQAGPRAPLPGLPGGSGPLRITASSCRVGSASSETRPPGGSPCSTARAAGAPMPPVLRQVHPMYAKRLEELHDQGVRSGPGRLAQHEHARPGRARSHFPVVRRSSRLQPSSRRVARGSPTSRTSGPDAGSNPADGCARLTVRLTRSTSLDSINSPQRPDDRAGRRLDTPGSCQAARTCAASTCGDLGPDGACT